ncbi:nucleoside diphosphate kinase A-like isoform X1 [Apus apus]|uniref:nucleoside diphosphate kinase A-like isoform X1 n=2 Tax=Apus apus TaxID=8895 RepID=UPI0021F8C663|nr:nucleoside diphosphate kinase A-like isoform X1 [Apus apus]
MIIPGKKKKDLWILVSRLFEQVFMSDSPTRTRSQTWMCDKIVAKKWGPKAGKSCYQKAELTPVQQQLLSPAQREVKSKLFWLQEEPGNRTQEVHPSFRNKGRTGTDFLSAGRVADARTRESRTMASISERTFIAIKPDGVQRGLVGEIIKRFEQKGFKLVAMKFIHASEDLLREHYIDLKDRPFYDGLVQYMHSGPVVAMVWEGLNVIKTGRVMLGETNPFDSKPGTIRGDFCIQVGRNIIHGSDSVESAETEINLWFTPEELVDYRSCAHEWIYG